MNKLEICSWKLKQCLSGHHGQLLKHVLPLQCFIGDNQNLLSNTLDKLDSMPIPRSPVPLQMRQKTIHVSAMQLDSAFNSLAPTSALHGHVWNPEVYIESESDSNSHCIVNQLQATNGKICRDCSQCHCEGLKLHLVGLIIHGHYNLVGLHGHYNFLHLGTYFLQGL